MARLITSRPSSERSQGGAVRPVEGWRPGAGIILSTTPQTPSICGLPPHHLQLHINQNQEISTKVSRQRTFDVICSLIIKFNIIIISLILCDAVIDMIVIIYQYHNKDDIYGHDKTMLYISQFRPGMTKPPAPEAAPW